MANGMWLPCQQTTQACDFTTATNYGPGDAGDYLPPGWNAQLSYVAGDMIEHDGVFYIHNGNPGDPTGLYYPGDWALNPDSITPWDVCSSCLYCGSSLVIPGCTDATADNYNSSATFDDGSCTYSPGGGSSV